MTSRIHCLIAVFVICLASAQARGQEGRAPGAPGTTGPENKYVELSKSKDRVIKATAERYLDLVKFREWGGANGKSLMAKYVSHDPDMKNVKLSVPKGTGKDRVVRDYDVELQRLDKVAQARVKQIDKLQKRLDELAAADAAKANGTSGAGSPAGSGAPVASEQPVQSPGPEAQPGAAQAAAPVVDPSASEPDPLGFAELPPVTPPAAIGPPGGPGNLLPTTPPGAAPTPVPGKPGDSADRKNWRTDLASFAANITAGTDPTGKPLVDWGELRELREINDIVVAQRGPEPPTRSPEAESPAAISERFGDMHWQIVVDKVDVAPGGLVVPSFHPVELAKPVELRFALDDTEDVQKWAQIPAGAKVNVSARLSISEPYKLTAKVKLADAK